MSLSVDDRREFCGLHGWVGRRAFQRDRHDLCEVPTEGPSGDDDEVEPDFDEEVDDEDVSDDEEDSEIEVTDLEEDQPRWTRAAARRRGIPSKKTLAVRRITQVELAAGRAELRALGADGPYDRPRTRADCEKVPRPCPYVSCSKNLYLDVSDTGSIILNFPHLEPGQMPADQSCSLDLAERGGMTLEEIAITLNLTRERIRQLELKGLRLLRRNAGPSADLAEANLDGEDPSDDAAQRVPKNGQRPR